VNYREMIRRDKLARLRMKSQAEKPQAQPVKQQSELGRGDKPARNGQKTPYLCVICGCDIEDQRAGLRGATNQPCEDCAHRIQYVADDLIDKADKKLRKLPACRHLSAPLRNGSRLRIVAAERRSIVVELREKHDATWGMIAKALGYRNHSSATHAYWKAKKP
jgi:hypothetical protein